MGKKPTLRAGSATPTATLYAPAACVTGLLSTPASAVMDQRYVNTVRACKVLLRNLDLLEETITLGQRTELTRLIEKLRLKLDEFLDEGPDEGKWIGEE
jgi:hypothetical protein